MSKAIHIIGQVSHEIHIIRQVSNEILIIRQVSYEIHIMRQVSYKIGMIRDKPMKQILNRAYKIQSFSKRQVHKSWFETFNALKHDKIYQEIKSLIFSFA